MYGQSFDDNDPRNFLAAVKLVAIRIWIRSLCPSYLVEPQRDAPDCHIAAEFGFSRGDHLARAFKPSVWRNDAGPRWATLMARWIKCSVPMSQGTNQTGYKRFPEKGGFQSSASADLARPTLIRRGSLKISSLEVTAAVGAVDRPLRQNRPASLGAGSSPPITRRSRTVRFPWILISVSSTSTLSVTKKDDGSMEVEIARTLPLTTC